ncbi:polysaccharide pyruvyl transferase family protein [Alteromonas sp. 1_MG-2023]|uniref:polysaccharide pyruvyl transferase family protein n=1 Tax=Alteromonas sp. 1_MG-2023 TaxID=3062669 RepID=UPI0026E3C788|nr:polysaccharide pyruvyl transferase family protein [Alteromonas sp. 1_MG-2023]MDO6475434.1 polysaccharide pyruvyl transferase family protein [Alteromonas sp. 1_MG-2023]
MNYDKKVYLRGAYGPGNLGDDVLMVAIINILSKRFKKKNIYVGVENINKARLLDPDVNFVNFKMPIKADLVVYGGGGQFFDFEGKSAKIDQTFISKLVNFIKRNKNPNWAVRRLIYSRNYDCIENLILSKNSATYAVGVGPFDFKGKGWSRLNSTLAHAGYISVRDDKSLSICQEITSKPIERVADPSFIKGNWATEISTKNEETQRFDITIILRDWPYSNDGSALINRLIAYGKGKVSEGKKVRFAFLYKGYDKETFRQVENYNTVEYCPSTMKPYEFVQEVINSSDVIISTRAHGIWLPVICGKPVIGVQIENKIKQVCNSLPNCTRTITPATKDIDKVVDDFKNEMESLTSAISTDIEKNVKLNEINESKFLGWVDEIFKNKH